MNAVHINQASRRTSPQAVQVKLDSLLEHIGIPKAVSRFTAQDELKARIEELEGLGPLVRLSRVLLLGRLLDLPGAPDLVAESPIFNLECWLAVGHSRAR